MAGNNYKRGTGGSTQGDNAATLHYKVREFLSVTARRATAFIAQAVGADRGATYEALSQLHADRQVTRRPDDRGRVWWGARCDVGLTRKERIVFALERELSGQLSTSQLCRAFGERDLRRGYQVLDYYRTVGLLEAVAEAIGVEAVWRMKQ